MLAKRLAACTRLSTTVSQLFEPQLQKIAIFKTIQCLPNPSQHVPICRQQFPSYSNRKCKKSPFSRTAAHIFISPADAPAIITQYVAWMERKFNACQTPRSMYLFIFNSFRVIRFLSQCVSPKIVIADGQTDGRTPHAGIYRAYT